MDFGRIPATVAPPGDAAATDGAKADRQSERAGVRAAPDIATTLGMAGTGRTAAQAWRRIAVWGIPAVLIVAGVTYYVMHRGPPPVQYSTTDARRGDLAVTVIATGTLAPLDTVLVGTEVSGVIDAVLVDYNDRVRQGQTLAIVNTDLLRAQIAQSRAALNAAQAGQRQTAATLIQTRQSTVRAESLFRQAVLALQEVESARGDLARAEAADSSAAAQIAVASAALQVQLTTLGKATIRAPIDGIVLERQVEPGRTVAATFQTPVLFVLAADLKRMTLALNIDEADIGQLKSGQLAEFTVDAYPDHAFTGTVRMVHNAAVMVEGVVTYQAILDVGNDDLLLRPGMTATATVKTATVHDALLVPNAALRFTPSQEPSAFPVRGQGMAASGHRVWALRAGSLAAIPISIGLSDGQWTQVEAGLVEAGMPLVTGIVDKAGAPAGSTAPGADTGRSAAPPRSPRGG